MENRDRVVTDEIIEKIGKSRIISDSAISSRISRRGEESAKMASSNHIRTVNRRGFRFVGEVTIARPQAFLRLSLED